MNVKFLNIKLHMIKVLLEILIHHKQIFNIDISMLFYSVKYKKLYMAYM